MSPRAELAAAVACLTPFGRPPESPEACVAGLALLPAVGLGLGAVAWGVGSLVGALLPGAAAVAGVGCLALVSGGRGLVGLAATAEAFLHRGPPAAVLARLRGRPGLLGMSVAAAALAARVAALAALAAPARAPALLAAPLLGAWAIVVQCYGGSPQHARGLARVLVGRARFREFGWASVSALGLTLAAGQAVGLAVAVAAALTAVGLRVLAHRRLGGLTGRLLAATREAVETIALGLLGLLAVAVS